ncbi:MAG: tetratricopeptide repeat protein [Saprospiraceae bacterium]|nr:tetratricopeptide repeat protein [Saprospiraceae bacterium]
MIIHRTIVLFCLLLFSIGGFAQDNFAVIEKIDSLILEGQNLFIRDPAKAQKQLLLAINESEKIHYIVGEIKGWGGMAKIQRHLNNKPKALEYLQTALKKSQIHALDELIALNLIAIGGIHQREGNYEMALQYYNEATPIADRLKNPVHSANILLSKGNNYVFQNLFSDGIPYYEKAIPIFESLFDTASLLRPVLNLGIAYYGIKEFVKSRSTIERALELALKINDQRNTCAAYISLADINIELKNFKQAIIELKSALHIAKDIDNMDLLKDCYERLSNSNSAILDFKEAYTYQSLYSKISLEIFNEVSNERLNRIEARFQTEKKEAKIENLTQENKMKDLHLSRNRGWIIALSSLIFVAISLIIIIALIVRRNQMKDQQDRVELEQKLLRSQMSPHFIFNSLVAIQSFVLNNESNEAGFFLGRFSRLMRLVLEHSRLEYVPLDKEIELLRCYLDLQSLRYSNSFGYSINTDGIVHAEHYSIPPMMAQPFIENSIEHGISELDFEGVIVVNFSLNGDTIVFTVQDNGVGISNAKKNKEHTSFATQITKERIALLNKNRKRLIQFKMEDLFDDLGNVSGTLTTFSIPFRTIS